MVEFVVPLPVGAETVGSTTAVLDMAACSARVWHRGRPVRADRTGGVGDGTVGNR